MGGVLFFVCLFTLLPIHSYLRGMFWPVFKLKTLEEPWPLPTELLSTIPFVKRSHVWEHDVEVAVRFWLTVDWNFLPTNPTHLATWAFNTTVFYALLVALCWAIRLGDNTEKWLCACASNVEVKFYSVRWGTNNRRLSASKEKFVVESRWDIVCEVCTLSPPTLRLRSRFVRVYC